MMMRRAILGPLVLSLVPLAGCSAYVKHLVPTLKEFRVAILVRPVNGQCRTTTMPPLALVSKGQDIVWEVISVDPGACDPALVTVTPKKAVAGFDIRRGELAQTLVVRGLAGGRYAYTVAVPGWTEDPELEVWR
jgi:hypothetical protein